MTTLKLYGNDSRVLRSMKILAMIRKSLTLVIIQLSQNITIIEAN